MKNNITSDQIRPGAKFTKLRKMNIPKCYEESRHTKSLRKTHAKVTKKRMIAY